MSAYWVQLWRDTYRTHQNGAVPRHPINVNCYVIIVLLKMCYFHGAIIIISTRQSWWMASALLVYGTVADHLSAKGTLSLAHNTRVFLTRNGHCWLSSQRTASFQHYADSNVATSIFAPRYLDMLRKMYANQISTQCRPYVQHCYTIIIHDHNIIWKTTRAVPWASNWLPRRVTIVLLSDSASKRSHSSPFVWCGESGRVVVHWPGRNSKRLDLIRFEGWSSCFKSQQIRPHDTQIIVCLLPYWCTWLTWGSRAGSKIAGRYSLK